MHVFRFTNLRSVSLLQKSFAIKQSCLQKRLISLSHKLNDASCIYRNGFAVFTLPLPSRQENCQFSLRPVSQNVKDLVSFIQEEDKGVDRVVVYSMDGTRIANATPIDMLIQQNFKIKINDKLFDIVPPKPENFPIVPTETLSNVKSLVSQLYTDLTIQDYKERREKTINECIESLKHELNPLEEQKAIIDAKAARKTEFLVWCGLGYMALQFGFLARLTWWEYSWDIMEPVTYFVTFGSSMIFYAYFVLTKQECTYPDARNRSHLLSFYRESKKFNFDTNAYNLKKKQIDQLEYELKLLQSPPVYVDIAKPLEN
ncbi:calcium uniporter protein, mitochondrial isoform X1 [Hydra vulgaris]|nr:calcium uniporter protein, mitochondrial [Hydra vulgaris]